MYYQSGSNSFFNNPVIPRENITPNNIADNFDERTVINDDLNMNNFFIYNLKNPEEEDQDAATKFYVDTKQYNLSSGNIIGNLDWNRISNIPSYFPSRISTTLIDTDINLGAYKIIKNGIELLGLTNNSVISSYIANNAVTDDKIQSVDYSKITNAPNPSSLSIPIGGIILWNNAVIPVGYLECDGSAVDSELHPDLANLMTNIPDLRGAFVRGLDHGKGYDTDRTLNSYQADSYASHNHTIANSGDQSFAISGNTSIAGSHVHITGLTDNDGDTAFGKIYETYRGLDGDGAAIRPCAYTSQEGSHSHSFSATAFGGNHNHGGATGNSGASETRPKNVALIYIIRAL
jgi:hypothetical protein